MGPSPRRRPFRTSAHQPVGLPAPAPSAAAVQIALGWDEASQLAAAAGGGRVGDAGGGDDGGPLGGRASSLQADAAQPEAAGLPSLAAKTGWRGPLLLHAAAQVRLQWQRGPACCMPRRRRVIPHSPAPGFHIEHPASPAVGCPAARPGHARAPCKCPGRGPAPPVCRAPASIGTHCRRLSRRQGPRWLPPGWRPPSRSPLHPTLSPPPHHHHHHHCLPPPPPPRHTHTHTHLRRCWAPRWACRLLPACWCCWCGTSTWPPGIRQP